MQTSLVVLEYIKALAWPVTVFVAVVAFRTDLRRLVARMTRVEALGAAAEFDHAVAEAGVDPAVVETPPADTGGQFVSVTKYEDARTLRDAYRTGPVLADLSSMPDDDAKRIVDFIAGLVSGGPGGSIERLSSKTFLVTPNRPRPR